MNTPRVAIVTGGGRGIGRGIVGELASRGMAVVVNYRGNAEAAAIVHAQFDRAMTARAADDLVLERLAQVPHGGTLDIVLERGRHCPRISRLALPASPGQTGASCWWGGPAYRAEAVRRSACWRGS